MRHLLDIYIRAEDSEKTSAEAIEHNVRRLIMDKAMPRWRVDCELLNSAPLAYEDWGTRKSALGGGGPWRTTRMAVR